MKAIKTVKLEVDSDTAKLVLTQLERQISDKRQERDNLSSDIEKLEGGYKSLREQLNGSGVEPERSNRGDNKARIKEYLSKNPKGAKGSEIAKATGIGSSSVAFTLNNYTKEFIKDEDTKRWRLATDQLI